MLKGLIKSEVQQNSIGQSILRTIRPRSVIPPILFGLAVELDHVFGSRWLIDELCTLGFSISYDEVRRFKHSILQSDGSNQLSQYLQCGFTQWVADNVDHNLATLDGQNTFHGMGVIALSSPTSCENVTASGQFRLPRKSTLLSEHICKDRGISIIGYTYPDKSGLELLKFKAIKELQSPYVLPQSLYADLLWKSGWFIKESPKPQPNWSGFMQDVTRGRNIPPADILFLPIIDLDPSDMTRCIYSTLLFVESQAQKLNMLTACITFDQALWIKAIEIIKGKSLKIVCRLGGFHLIISYLGSIGRVMPTEGSGLSEVLETAYGANAVTHIALWQPS